MPNTISQRCIKISIDRGGTFTDCIGIVPVPISPEHPLGRLEIVVKLLSVDPQNYSDAPREGIRRILEKFTGKPHPKEKPVDTSLIGIKKWFYNLNFNFYFHIFL